MKQKEPISHAEERSGSGEEQLRDGFDGESCRPKPVRSVFRRIRGPLSAILAIVLLYAVFFLTGIGCPIKFITGISCAGCGMTRAWFSLLHLDFAAAYSFHPLFWLPPVVLAALLLKNKLPRRLYRGILFTCILLCGIVYLVRLIRHDGDVVVLDPANNLLFRLLRRFFS